MTKKKHNIVPNNNASVMVVSLHSSALSEKSYTSCDKPLLQTVITSPLLICFCQAIFSIVNSFPVVILGTNLLEIKFFLFFFFRKSLKKSLKKISFMVLKSRLNFFSFQKYLYYLRVLQNLFENIL